MGPFPAVIQTAFSAEEEILSVLKDQVPMDALDIFQRLKTSIFQKLDQQADEMQKLLPAGMALMREATIVPPDFNYDVVVKVLEAMVHIGRLKKGKSGGDDTYFVA